MSCASSRITRLGINSRRLTNQTKQKRQQVSRALHAEQDSVDFYTQEACLSIFSCADNILPSVPIREPCAWLCTLDSALCKESHSTLCDTHDNTTESLRLQTEIGNESTLFPSPNREHLLERGKEKRRFFVCLRCSNFIIRRALSHPMNHFYLVLRFIVAHVQISVVRINLIHYRSFVIVNGNVSALSPYHATKAFQHQYILTPQKNLSEGI